MVIQVSVGSGAMELAMMHSRARKWLGQAAGSMSLRMPLTTEGSLATLVWPAAIYHLPGGAFRKERAEVVWPIMPAVPRTGQALLKEAIPLSLGVDWAQNDCIPALLLPIGAEQLLTTVLQNIRWHYGIVRSQKDPQLSRRCDVPVSCWCCTDR